jgi:hypothetical protein
MNSKKNFGKLKENNTKIKNHYDLLHDVNQEDNLESLDSQETEVVYDLNLEVSKTDKNIEIIDNTLSEKSIRTYYNQDNSKWKKQEKRHNKFKKKTKRVILNISDEEKENIENYNLSIKWNVWVHNNHDTNWDLDSYKVIHVIEDIKTFWLFFGNLINLDYENYQYYIMRETSCPIWEHPSNSNGGTCSIRFLKDKLLDIVEQLAILIITDNFNNKPEEINGLSFGTKTHWGLVKIWTSDGNNDVSVYVPNYMNKLYSMTNKYKYNEPNNKY